MKTVFRQWIFWVLTGISLPALAERPSFNYLELGPTSMEHETVEGDFKGFEFTGSYELPDNFYLFTKYVRTDDQDIDMINKYLGIGYHYHLFADTRLILQLDAAEITFGRQEAGEFVEKGFQWSVGIKSQLTESLEVEFVARALDANQVDSEFGYYRPSFMVLGFHHKIFDDFSIFADFEKGSESDRQVVGIRWDY
ncbi:hypothetical protein [Aliikangiella sp. G2MR2-5]|uniref:hypothetical protein n=1 Tax=Aliikangiella sp. G2MR2-5 TaxID=2788943 RepID=UPI0018AC40A8|nr:hypothetical protein [Aliikangiella sp. G2MR2-5]